jgi:hypothetical protein
LEPESVGAVKSSGWFVIVETAGLAGALTGGIPSVG